MDFLNALVALSNFGGMRMCMMISASVPAFLIFSGSAVADLDEGYYRCFTQSVCRAEQQCVGPDRTRDTLVIPYGSDSPFSLVIKPDSFIVSDGHGAAEAAFSENVEIAFEKFDASSSRFATVWTDARVEDSVLTAHIFQFEKVPAKESGGLKRDDKGELVLNAIVREVSARIICEHRQERN